MTEKILVVDDDIDSAVTMRDLLRQKKFNVTTVSNGAAALDALEDNSYSLVLIDIKMPTVSGYDLMRLIKLRQKDSIKLVYVSIVPKDEVDREGVDGFVQKPLSEKNLISEIQRVLKK